MSILKRLCSFFRPLDVSRLFFTQLVRHTENFGNVTWLGKPIWQNVLDLWVIQEAIHEVQPELIIECGTNRGGSAIFYAHLLDLMGKGRIISIDVVRLHESTHDRVTFLIGDSASEPILSAVRAEVAKTSGPILVILDSDHSETHVTKELHNYAGFVTSGSYCLVQDGVIDTLEVFSSARPGPLVSIEKFLANDKRFEIDTTKTNRFLITHHPKGWLRRL